MKIFAINSSPNAEKGNTAIILNAFLEGVRHVGADVELHYTKKLKINPCLGCYSCWLKTPGVCVQKDDMNALLPKIFSSEVVVFASPLYIWNVNGPMKNFMDRMLPLAKPELVEEGEYLRHPPREGVKSSKFVLVSTGSLWDGSNFDPLLAYFGGMCQLRGKEFVGALLRPHAAYLRQPASQDVIEAAREAGKELVEEGRFSWETLHKLGRELVPRDIFFRNMNRWAKG